jgi:hypothetical protein
LGCKSNFARVVNAVGKLSKDYVEFELRGIAVLGVKTFGTERLSNDNKNHNSFSL